MSLQANFSELFNSIVQYVTLTLGVLASAANSIHLFVVKSQLMKFCFLSQSILILFGIRHEHQKSECNSIKRLGKFSLQVYIFHHRSAKINGIGHILPMLIDCIS